MTTYEKLFTGYEDKIPEMQRRSLFAYLNDGIPPGSFMEAVLRNDLLGAIAYADNDAVAALKYLAQVLHSRVPSGCFGSMEALKRHMKTARQKPGYIFGLSTEPTSIDFVKGL